MRLIRFGGFSLGKCRKIWKNGCFFRAAMAGLEKYHTGCYSLVEVYRVNVIGGGGKVLHYK